MDTTTTNEFKKYQDIRHLAKEIAESIGNPENIAATTDKIVELAGAITAQDMSGYATKQDVKDIRADITHMRNEVLIIESRLLIKIAESSTSNLKWTVGILLIQTGLIIGVMGKMLGKW